MNVIVCDSCGKQTDEPHSMKVREFNIGLYATGEPAVFKKKVRIHLCPDCFYALCTIAEERRKKQ